MSSKKKLKAGPKLNLSEGDLRLADCNIQYGVLYFNFR